MNYEEEIDKAIYNLLWIWRQYDRASTEDWFSHACMGAGENAAMFLERHGYGVEDGWGFKLNDKAKTLMDKWEMEE